MSSSTVDPLSTMMSLNSCIFILRLSTSSTGQVRRLRPVFTSNSTVRGMPCAIYTISTTRDRICHGWLAGHVPCLFNYLERGPALENISTLTIGLSDVSPLYPPLLHRIVKRPRRVKLAPVEPLPDPKVGRLIVRGPGHRARVERPDGIVIVPFVVHAPFQHMLHVLPGHHKVFEGSGSAGARSGNGIELDALPHADPVDGVEDVGEEGVVEKVLGGVDHGNARVLQRIVLGPDHYVPRRLRRVVPDTILFYYFKPP